MTRVLGIDPSCRSTGIALPTGRTITLKTPSSMAGGRRLHWIAGRVAHLCRLYDPQVAVLEDYAPNSNGILSTIRSAEVGGVIRLALWEAGIPFVEVRPNTLKRYATENGNAPKERMILAASVAGANPANDDEADAWLLRALGRHFYDGTDVLDVLDGPERHNAHRLETLAALDWPEARQ